MLKLKGITKIEKIVNESDFYVRIKIGFTSWYATRHPICYLSTGGGVQKSLIEIRLIKLSGAICAFTVISMPKIHGQENSHQNKNVTEKIGLPLFDISSWQETGYYMEERKTGAKDFEIYATPNSVSIVFSPNEITLKVINGPIVFGFDSNDFLCSIQMLGMKLNEEGFLESVSD